jgi:hypothetical protein
MGKRPSPGGQARLSESQLWTLWRGQRFPAGALVTRQGVPVRVIFQGRAGRGAGPDFRDAVIAGPSGVPLRGDVELHVRSSSFRAHGHATDAAYARVVLHVVFEDDTGVDTPLPGGGSAPVVALGPWVTRRAGEIERWLVRPVLWREPCHDAVARLGTDGVGSALDAEGDRRFEDKVRAAADAIAARGVEQALYEGLLEALGYGGNRAAMAAIARMLPWPGLHRAAGSGGDRRMRMEALLLGTGGLVRAPAGGRPRAPADEYARRLEDIWDEAALPSLPDGAWRRGVRPENAPARRLAAAAAVLARAGMPGALLEPADADAAAAAVAPLLVAAEGFWRDHHDLHAAPSRLPAGLIGRGRALEILVNVILPAACAAGDAGTRARARDLFGRLPRPAVYGATRFIEAAIGGEGGRVRLNARRAQGLLELRRNWCTQGGCGRCALSQ